LLLKYSNSSVIWTLENGYLSYDGQKIYLHSVNKQSLLFFKANLKENNTALLVYPSNRMTITPLLALEALYYRLHENRLPSGRDRLIIFSSRIELRKEIRDHFTSFKAGGMPLYYDSFPLGRITSKGEIVKIIARTSEPRLLISPGIAALPNADIAQLAFGVILEATPDLKIEDAERILNWAANNSVPFQFIVSPDPPTELAKMLIEKNIPYWGWEAASLEEDCHEDELNLQNKIFQLEQPFCRNYKEIRNKAVGVKKILVPVKEKKLNKMLMDLRKDYLQLKKAAAEINSPQAIEVSKRFLGCIYALEEILSPLAYAETELVKRWGTIPINHRIETLINHCEGIRPYEPLFASYARQSAARLSEAYIYMAEEKSGKHPIIIQIINEAIANEKSVLFVSKNEALNEGLKSYLEIEKGMSISNLNQNGIEFVYVNQIYRNTSNVNVVDSCILYGCPRYYQKNIIAYAKARSIGIIAYESEIPAIKYIHDQIVEIQNLFSDKYKRDIAERLFGVATEDRKIPKRENKDKKKTDLIFIDPQDAEMGSFAPKDIFSDFLALDWRIDFEYSSEGEVNSTNKRLGTDSSCDMTAVKVSLPGERHILLNIEKFVQVYDDSTEKVKDIPAKSLKKGYLLILIENSTRKTLAESIISKVEAHPSMMEIVVYQRAWLHFLRESIEENEDTFIEVIRKLKEHGARGPSTPAAIFHWVNGTILGPSELENIRRIGIIYDKPFLVANFDDIKKAVLRLRTIHRSLSRRLNKLIPQAGIEAERIDRGNTVIDEDLELYIEDFANIVSIERVEKIEILKNVSSGDLERVVYN